MLSFETIEFGCEIPESRGAVRRIEQVIGCFAALQLGKHVLTEKPFAMTVAEGEELVALSESAGRVLAIVHNFQFAPSTRRRIDDIDSGALGTVRGVIAQQYGNPARRERYRARPNTCP